MDYNISKTRDMESSKRVDLVLEGVEGVESVRGRFWDIEMSFI